MIRMRQKMFSNSGGFGFNVSFADRASMLNLSLRRRLASPMIRLCGVNFEKNP